jgi:4-amino-4-deoxy-L-arabinose transferase-like glycosyltransferase
VNALAALLLYLVVRAYTRGITPRLGAAIGATLVLAPLMKGTAFALYPAVAVGLAFVLWRHRGRRTLVSLALLAATALVLFGAWSAVSGYFDRDTFTTPGGTAPGSNFGGVRSPGGLLSYLWQLFLPPLGFMTDLWVYPNGWPFFDIYVVRGWASFGWYAMTFSDWVYWVIVVVMPVVGAMAAVALWRLRARIRDIGPPLLVLVLAIAALIAGVHAFYYPNGPRSPPFPEQGRYAFPLMVAFATIAVGSSYAFGRRWVVHIATTLVVAVMGMAYASQLLALTRFYS